MFSGSGRPGDIAFALDDMAQRPGAVKVTLAAFGCAEDDIGARVTARQRTGGLLVFFIVTDDGDAKGVNAVRLPARQWRCRSRSHTGTVPSQPRRQGRLLPRTRVPAAVHSRWQPL